MVDGVKSRQQVQEDQSLAHTFGQEHLYLIMNTQQGSLR